MKTELENVEIVHLRIYPKSKLAYADIVDGKNPNGYITIKVSYENIEMRTLSKPL
jgi:hypothetical protein